MVSLASTAGQVAPGLVRRLLELAACLALYAVQVRDACDGAPMFALL